MAKESYVGIDNVARKVKSLYIGVDGVARKVKKAYIGADGIAREWYSSAKKLSSCAVGTIVQLPENGTNVEYIVVHQGLPSSSYDASCNGTWLMRKEIHSASVWCVTGYNDYENSTISSYLKTTFYNQLSSSVKSNVKTVKIPYRAGRDGTTVSSGANGLSTKVFALSMKEVNLTDSTSPVEGATLSYFKGAGATKRVAYYNDNPGAWWLRSPSAYDGQAWSVNEDGAKFAGNCDGNSFGVRPVFIMNDTVLLDPDTNTIL